MEVSARYFSISFSWNYCQPLGRFHVWEGRTYPVLRGSSCPSAAIAETFGPLSLPFYVLSSLSAQNMGLLRMDVFHVMVSRGRCEPAWETSGSLLIPQIQPWAGRTACCHCSCRTDCRCQKDLPHGFWDDTSSLVPEPQPWQPHQPHPPSAFRLLSSACPKVSVWINALMSPCSPLLG